MVMTSCIAPTRRNKNDDSKNISVIILAGSYGHRMKSYGPKCLLKIENQQTILQHNINIIREILPQSEIILVVGFEADKVIRNSPNDIRIVENQLYEDTGELEQIRLSLNNINNKEILIVGSDIVFNTDTIKNTSLTKSLVIYDSNNNLSSEEIGITVVDNKATFFSYTIPKKWCQICYLEGRALQLLKNMSSDRLKGRMFLFEALNMITQKTIIQAIEPTGMSILKIDSSKDLQKLNENINRK